MSVFHIVDQGKIFDNDSELLDQLIIDLSAQSFQKVVLSGCSYGVQACERVSQVLAENTDLKDCVFSDIFTGRLRAEIPTCLTYFSDALLDKELRELDLSDNAFGPDGARAILPLLVAGRSMSVLKLNNNGLGPEGGVIIAEGLGDTTNGPCQLEVFISGRGRLENEGSTAIAGALTGVNTLKEIRIPQNGIYQPGLGAVLRSLNEDIEVIDFNDNNLSGGEEDIRATLPKFSKLKELNLGDCFLSMEESLAVLESLADNETLEVLDLTYAHVNDELTQVLANNFANKPNLRVLDLNGNHFTDVGKEILQTFLESIGKEEILGTLSDNESESFDDEEFYEED